MKKIVIILGLLVMSCSTNPDYQNNLKLAKKWVEAFETSNLEVSSPGIFRKLKTSEHFKAFKGQRIKVRLQQKIQGIKNTVGKLEECSEEEIHLILETDGSELVIPISQITKANLEPILDF